MLRGLVIATAVAAGCGGAERPARVAKPAPSQTPRALLVLYSDGAEVRVRVSVGGSGGVVELSGLPPSARYTLRSVEGKAAAGARVVGPTPRPSRAHLRGAEVIASRGGRRIEGVITAVRATEIQIQTESGVESLALPVELALVGTRRSGPLSLRTRAGARGEVEVSSWVDNLEWKVGYSAVVSGATARLQGWLSLTNNGGRAIEVDDVAVSLAGDEGGASAAHRIGRSLSLPPGSTVELPLMLPVEIGAALVEVYDPIGDHLDHEGRRPVARPSYGTRPGAPPEPLAVALSLDQRRLDALPAGEIAAYRRVGGVLTAVGHGEGFAAPARVGAPVELDARPPKPASEKIVVGRSHHITGRRWQEEIASDLLRRRLVEEIRVELHNGGDREVVVDVREHLYRGLNWAVVYHNQAGRLVKTKPQEIRFAVEVPAGKTRLVAYRVAYTW